MKWNKSYSDISCGVVIEMWEGGPWDGGWCVAKKNSIAVGSVNRKEDK